MSNHIDFYLEQDKLNSTRSEIKEKIPQAIDSAKSVIPTEYSDWSKYNKSWADANIKHILDYNLEILISSYVEPYYGRLDYENEGQKFTVYISKSSINLNSVELASIWSPIGKVFNQGIDNKYISTINLKRRINNIDGKIFKIHDDIAPERGSYCDSYIIDKLKKSSTNRMQDIIETLQKEQDEIIRNPFNCAIFIQGVAGSGKTAVALHRIAYLVYNYKRELNDSILVIGPNKIYLNYISNLLPGLGVKNVQQTTFTDLALSICKLKSLPPNNYVADGDDLLVSEIKDYIHNINSKYFEILTGFTVKAESINNPKIVTYKIRKEQLINTPINKRAEEYGKILREKILYDFCREEERISKDGLKLSPKVNVQDYNLYFRGDVNKYISSWPKLSVEETLKNMQKERALSPTDQLACRLLLTKLIEGIRQEYNHIVIDEAQDLPPLGFLALINLQKETSLTVLGDVCQRNDNELFSWDTFVNMTSNPLQYILRKSYRSTDNIVSFYNKVANRTIPAHDYERFASKTIGRKGADPKVYEITEIDLLELINSIVNKDDVNLLAIICKDEGEALRIGNLLSSLNPTIIKDDVTDYNEKGIIIMTANQSRGLEFDAVIIADAHRYGVNWKDARLLYVALSRAMHHLVVLYKDRLTTLLAGN